MQELTVRGYAANSVRASCPQPLWEKSCTTCNGLLAHAASAVRSGRSVSSSVSLTSHSTDPTHFMFYSTAAHPESALAVKAFGIVRHSGSIQCSCRTNVAMSQCGCWSMRARELRQDVCSLYSRALAWEPGQVRKEDMERRQKRVQELEDRCTAED